MADVIQAVQSKFPGAILEIVEYQGERTLVVQPGRVRAVLGHLKQSEGFNFLADISSAHWPEEGRIDVVYIVRSLKSREQLRIRTPLPIEDPAVETVSDLWGTADWLEREVYDLMGVQFTGHPDLRRIMLPEDFEGHPLRKEYPMEGDDEWRNYVPPETRENRE